MEMDDEVLLEVLRKLQQAELTLGESRNAKAFQAAIDEINKLKKEIAYFDFKAVCYAKDANKATDERDKARRTLCNEYYMARNCRMPAEEIAKEMGWDCFDEASAEKRKKEADSAEALIRRNSIADEILSSEQFMWLMVGSEQPKQHIDDLRTAWRAWQEAGGKTYGRR